ncbi:unnamed protein product [Dicrocoelium dendriticum]|nr:unnamed protein product [Dicrocoelium dendriticum]
MYNKQVETEELFSESRSLIGAMMLHKLWFCFSVILMVKTRRGTSTDAVVVKKPRISANDSACEASTTSPLLSPTRSVHPDVDNVDTKVDEDSANIADFVIDRAKYEEILRCEQQCETFLATLYPLFDPKLPISKRMVVPKSYTSVTSHEFPLLCAAHTANHYSRNNDFSISITAVALAAYTVASFGLLAVRQCDGSEEWERDGDWIFTDAELPINWYNVVEHVVKDHGSAIPTMALLIFATKVNYWRSNHHTTEHKNLPCMLYKLSTRLSLKMGMVIGNEAARTFGRWASTLAALGYMGKNVRPVIIIGRRKQVVEPNAEMREYLNCLPAGCRKLAYCYNVFAHFAGTALMKCLDEWMFSTIISTVEKYMEIKDFGARSHISAQYLTGKERIPYDDALSPGGMAISYVIHMAPRSSFAKIPYFLANKNGGYKSLPAYSPIFEPIVESCARTLKGLEIRGSLDCGTAHVRLASAEGRAADSSSASAASSSTHHCNEVMSDPQETLRLVKTFAKFVKNEGGGVALFLRDMLAQFD